MLLIKTIIFIVLVFFLTSLSYGDEFFGETKSVSKSKAVKMATDAALKYYVPNFREKLKKLEKEIRDVFSGKANISVLKITKTVKENNVVVKKTKKEKIKMKWEFSGNIGSGTAGPVLKLETGFRDFKLSIDNDVYLDMNGYESYKTNFLFKFEF